MDYNDQNIHQLLVEKLTGKLSPEEEAYVNKLINERADISAAWQDMQQLQASRGDVFLKSLDESKAWNALQEKLDDRRAHRLRLKPWHAISAAASILLVFGVIFLLNHKTEIDGGAPKVAIKGKAGVELTLANGSKVDLSGRQSRTVQTTVANLKIADHSLTYTSAGDEALAWNVLTVPTISDYKIVLSDGTMVWLNSASSLKFPFAFSNTKREVYLTGEAYFEVAKNPAKPFIVHTEQTTVQVLGTSFNVNAYDQNNITTALVEGSVKTWSGEQQVLLKPGFEAEFNQSKGFSRHPFDEESVLSWRQGIVYFHNADLAEISHILNRWFDITVKFDSDYLKEQTFTGAIDKHKPVKLFLRNLETTSGISSYLKDGVLHFK
jgi:ferric-dicitrate binding protein FerR (iron transport regulator)